MPKFSSPIIPFRWDLSKREQLGDLANHPKADIPHGYYQDVRAICAKVIAFSDACDLVFVGRSPEHLFDYLNGSFQDLEQRPSLTLFQFSKAVQNQTWTARTGPPDFKHREVIALLGHLIDLNIDPLSLTASKRALRFVDFVSTGGTFRDLLALYKRLAEHQKADWNIVERRLGFIGITNRKKNSPNTYRWQQSEEWKAMAGKVGAKNISVSWPFWDHCANQSEKVTPSHHRGRWVKPKVEMPEYGEAIQKALARSVDIYEFANSAEERKLFSQALSSSREIHHAWLRKLAHDLKFG